MYVISDRAVAWIPPGEIEDTTLRQIEMVSRMPFVFRHVAVMPDCHLGKGATVGSVIPTVGAIIPAAVGVDIGCGMVAVRTSLKRDDLPKDLSDIREGIERRIPLAAGGVNRSLTEGAAARVALIEKEAGDRLLFYDRVKRDWREQLGTLGSGNHFIEVVLDETGDVWAFLHSGSRGIGARVAEHHIGIAKSEMSEAGVDLQDPDLAFLTEGTPTFDDYISDLYWCQDYALQNRAEMMERVLTELSYAVHGDDRGIERVETVMCHHNFTARETHFGEDVWVSRKGAIEASEGQPGLIPGSMGTRSYCVRGLGEPESFRTAPHGAGRRFSRGEARRRFTMEDYDRSMQGIEARRSPEFLDELPEAYKDIDEVMEHSRDLVSVTAAFSQIVNVKGPSGFRRSRRRRRRG